MTGFAMTPRLQAVPFPGRASLLSAVRSVLAKYSGTAVTVRQLYYRLVAAGTIPNNFRAYKNLVAALADWRRGREIPFTAFEDRTRGMNRLDLGLRHDNPTGWCRVLLARGVKDARNYQLARWYGQPCRVIVAVEKQALEGPFTAVCEDLCVDLAVCRGYSSLSFLYEVAESLDANDSARDGRENVILYFGDLDPSGLNIPQTVERDLADLFGKEFAFERIALTREQATAMDLIPAPVKLTDSRAASFINEHGEEVFELDAIEPERLQEMIREAVDGYWDEGIAGERDMLVEKGRERINGILKGAGVDDLLRKLEDEEDGEGGE